MGFISLDDFHPRKLRPGEPMSVFVHDLKKLIDHAIPNMEKEARDPLLLHQFLAGLPDGITRQLRASGEVKTLEAATKRPRLLIAIDSQPVAMLEEKPSEVQLLTEQVALLTEQVALLTEQVAALSTHQQRDRLSESRRQPCCFSCSQFGHVQRNCPYHRQEIRCYACGQSGHIARNCQLQGNEWGTLGQGYRCPLQEVQPLIQVT